MKCKDCKHCKQGWFKSKPNEYVCIGVKEPFVISNIENECTEYFWLSDMYKKPDVYIKQEPYVDDYGIYVPVNEYVQEGRASTYKCVLTKELFIEAYNKWIKGSENEPN